MSTMGPTRRVVVINCSDAVLAKINSKHGVTLQDVRDTFQLPAVPASAYWLDDPLDERGPRLLVEGWNPRGHRLRAVLYPVAGDPGAWRLGTAWRVRR